MHGYRHTGINIFCITIYHQNPKPIHIIDLRTVTRLSPIDQERETFVPNAFVLETQKEGSYQVFADSKSECMTILTALQTVISS